MKKILRALFNKKALKGYSLGGGYVLAQAILGPPLLLQTGDDYLRDREIDPAILHSLSDRPMHIYGTDFASELFAHTGWLYPYQDASPARFHSVIDNILKRCLIGLRPVSPQKHIEIDVNLAPGQLVADRIPLDDYNTYVMFHEARHCHPDNIALGGNRMEADADLHALRAARETGLDPALQDAVLHARAFNIFSHTHNIALFIDADRHGRPLPTEQDIVTARQQLAAGVVRRIMNYCQFTAKDSPSGIYINQIDIRQLVDILDAVHREDDLSPAAQRMIKLFMAGVDYYLPDLAPPGTAYRTDCPTLGLHP